MKAIMRFIATGIILPSVALSAELSFEDRTVDVKGSHGFSAMGPGFVGEPLRNYQKVSQKKFEITLVNEGSVAIPMSTMLLLKNADDDTHTTMEAYPPGIIAWTFDKLEGAHGTYRFSVSAGGNFNHENEQPYQIELLVDGESKGVTKTAASGYWYPRSYYGVAFHKDSHVQVIISPKADNETPAEENENLAQELDEENVDVAELSAKTSEDEGTKIEESEQRDEL